MLTKPGGAGLIPPAMLLLTLASASSAQTTSPTTTEPVRGLEALQANGNTPIPVPDTPTLVLPGAARPPRDPATQRQPRQATQPSPTDRQQRGSEPAPAAREPRPGTGSDRANPAPTARPESQPARVEQDVRQPDEARVPASVPATAPTAGSASASQTQVAPVPAPVAPAAEPAASSQTSIAAPETGRSMPFWLWLAVIPLVCGVVWLLQRRPRTAKLEDHRADVRETVDPAPDASIVQPAADTGAGVADTLPSPRPLTPAVPAAVAIPPAAAAAAAAAEPAAPRFLEPRAPTRARARLSVELRPLRAGLNLLSATAECQIVVTNTGTEPASGIRIHASLLTAHAGQDADLAAINAAPVTRPATAPFALAAGESRVVRTVSAIPRDAIHGMTAANRPMFVPIVAVNILYDSGDGPAQTARAWAIGVERVDSAKLAPFWLDAPARMYDNIAARPHAVAVDR
jgi:hypothetical protein